MLETQENWYRPALRSLGWHVGCKSPPPCLRTPALTRAVWNLVGALGFTLSGACGFAAAGSTQAAYQSALSTFWGGWAFLLGSVVQWYESVNAV